MYKKIILGSDIPSLPQHIMDCTGTPIELFGGKIPEKINPEYLYVFAYTQASPEIFLFIKENAAKKNFVAVLCKSPDGQLRPQGIHFYAKNSILKRTISRTISALALSV